MRPWTLLALLAGIGTTASAEPARTLEQLLPKNALFAVSVRSAPELVARYKSHPLARLLAAPELRPMLDEMARDIDKDGGPSFLEVFKLIAGRVVVAGIPEAGKERPEPVLLAEFGDNADEAKRLMRQDHDAFDRKEGIDVPYREEEFRGTTIRHRTYTHKGKSRRSASFWLRGLSVNTERLETARAIIARHQAESDEHLEANESWSGLRRTVGRDADVFWWVSPKTWTAGFDEESTFIAKALGLDQIEAVAGAARLREAGLELTVLVSAPRARGGIFDVIPGGRQVKPSALQPPDWGAHVVLTLDLKETVAGVIALIGRFNPPLAGQARAVVGMLAPFLAATGNRITVSVPPLEAREGASPEQMGFRAGRSALMILDVKDHAAMRTFLSEAVGKGVIKQVTEYLGFPVYRAQELHVALLPDALVWAMDVEQIRVALRRHGKDLPTLKDSPVYRRATKGLPNGMGVFFYGAISAGSEFWKATIELARGTDGERAAAMAVVKSLESFTFGFGRDPEAGLRMHLRLGFKPTEDPDREDR